MLYRAAILLPIVLSSSSELPNKPDRTARLLLLRLYYSSVPLLLLFHSITLFSYTIFSLIHSILSVSCILLLLHTTCFAIPFFVSLFSTFYFVLFTSPLIFFILLLFSFLLLSFQSHLSRQNLVSILSLCTKSYLSYTTLLSPQTLAVFSVLFQHLYLKLRGGYTQTYQTQDPFIRALLLFQAHTFVLWSVERGVASRKI